MHDAVPRIDELFWEAAQLAPGEERESFLARACGEDQALRQRLEHLLQVQPKVDSFLERPIADPNPFPTVDETPDAVPGTQIGPYKLLEQIGEGGMGLVFVAEQHEPIRRRVALKVIKPGMDSRQVIARFEAERQALALMDHPHIAKVHDGGATPQGRPYFVMELVKGIPITDFCDQHRLTTRQRLELFLDVCHAVQHAHQKGIIHRDLKPSNVLVEVHDVHPVVKVIDFGIAKAMGQQLTDKTVYTGAVQVVGTPLYMSPEQAGLSSLDIDTRSDVYSLGVVLYELLTGTTPFDSETLKKGSYDEMRRIIREDEPPRPSTCLSTMQQAQLSTIAERRGLEPHRLSQQLRGELDWIVMKALEKDRNRRYESASAFAADVQRYLNDEPVQACPPSKLYLLGKFLRRHKAGLGMAAVLLLAMMLVASSLLWWLQKRARAEGEVRVAIQEARELLEAERWSEALSAARRAEGVLAGIGGDSGLHQQVQELIEDLKMARRLQEARLRQTAVKDGHFDNEAGAMAYADAFREYGLDVDGLDPQVTAEQIRARPINRQLVAALDDWAISLRILNAEGWKQRFAVTRAADPDLWRNRLRDWVEGKGRKGVEELVAAGLEKEWPVQTLALLAHSVSGVPSGERESVQFERVGVLLMQAQRQRPDDFWINQSLVGFLLGSRLRRQVELMRFASITVALQPQSPGTHFNLGEALHGMGRLDEAIAEYREAIRLKPDYSEVHYRLGSALIHKGQLDEAIAECREAVRLRKDSWDAHTVLGMALIDKGQLDEAIAECREAVRLYKDNAGLHLNLGRALDFNYQVDEALAEYREAIRLNKDYAEAHVNLGWIHHKKGRLDEAIAEYREAIRLDKGLVQAHINLARAFQERGEFRMAQEELRRSSELYDANPRLRQQAASCLQYNQRYIELEPRLPRFLQGEEQPTDAAERLTLAKLCALKKLYVASARWYGEAFAERPSLADDLASGNRYDAACAAALAGCGQGKDVASLSNKERDRLRRQALNWLKDDLHAKQHLLAKDPDKTSPIVGHSLRHWLHDPDLNGVRGTEALSKLPEAERPSWQQLWAEVVDSLAKCQGNATPKKKPESK